MLSSLIMCQRDFLSFLENIILFKNKDAYNDITPEAQYHYH